MRGTRMDGYARTPRELLENRDRFAEFLDLVLCFPAFFTKPDKRLS